MTWLKIGCIAIGGSWLAMVAADNLTPASYSLISDYNIEGMDGHISMDGLPSDKCQVYAYQWNAQGLEITQYCERETILSRLYWRVIKGE